MTALPETLTGAEPLSELPVPHHVWHDELHVVYNKMTGEYGDDPLTPAIPSGLGIDIFDGSLAAPNTTAGVTFRITRDDLFAAAPDLSTPSSVYNPAYFAGAQVNVRSQAGNIVQPTGIWSYVYGHAQVPPGQTAGAYLLPFYASAVHTSGADGGAMGYYTDALSSVASVTASVFAFGATVTNNTGIDMTAVQKRGGGLDLAVGGPNIAGNILQLRALSAGVASLLYGNGTALVGLDLSAFNISGYALDAQTTGIDAARFRTKGTGQVRVIVDVSTAGQRAGVHLADAGTIKHSVYKESDNTFQIINAVTATANFIGLVNGGTIIGAAGKTLGAFGSTGTTIQTITGSKAGATATVLGSLLTALAGHGIIVDSTT